MQNHPLERLLYEKQEYPVLFPGKEAIQEPGIMFSITEMQVSALSEPDIKKTPYQILVHR